MAVLKALLASLQLIVSGVEALRVAPGSPCADLCDPISNTTGKEIVCEDKEFETTRKGRKFKDCVSCALQSEYENQETGETDVNWALYNLRYAFSSCVFGFPEKVSNISTPCVVSCHPVEPALEFQLKDPNPSSLHTFCGDDSFADNDISQCKFCYGLTSQQAYLSNFVEAVRYNCHFQTEDGKPFAIAPTAIFNTSALPTTTAEYSSSATAGELHGIKNLALVIVLPIIGFIIIVALLAVGCFFLVRHQRKLAKKHGMAQHLHARGFDTTISTPFQTVWAGNQPVSPAWGGPETSQMTPLGLSRKGSETSDFDGRWYGGGYAATSQTGFSSFANSQTGLVPMPSQQQAFASLGTSPQDNSSLAKQQEMELQAAQLQHLQQAQSQWEQSWQQQQQQQELQQYHLQQQQQIQLQQLQQLQQQQQQQQQQPPPIPSPSAAAHGT